MVEYIKKYEDAINVVEKYFTEFLQLEPDICLDGIRSLPAADVVERRRGEWKASFLVKALEAKPTAWYCSECHQITKFRTFFCPNCGADMRGET